MDDLKGKLSAQAWDQMQKQVAQQAKNTANGVLVDEADYAGYGGRPLQQQQILEIPGLREQAMAQPGIEDIIGSKVDLFMAHAMAAEAMTAKREAEQAEALHEAGVIVLDEHRKPKADTAKDVVADHGDKIAVEL